MVWLNKEIYDNRRVQTNRTIMFLSKILELMGWIMIVPPHLKRDFL